ncbi:MAG: sigma-70 family RNA polymerase sigma factor [Erysipelotrichaceae bacterium]|nr:sigma-70 family RNA polymerase sigma factor [Erysipelotrichaceae bacterium]
MEENMELIGKIRNGDDKAFSALVNQYRRMIYKIIYTYNLDSGDFRIDAEDLFQEGCLALYDSVFSYEEGRNVRFSTYAYLVIKGKIRDRLRTLSRSQGEGVYSLEKATDHDLRFCVCSEPLQYHREQVIKERIDRFFAGLKEEDRQILQMKKEDCSYKQISERLGINRKKVDNRIRYLKKRLKKQLQEDGF